MNRRKFLKISGAASGGLLVTLTNSFHSIGAPLAQSTTQNNPIHPCIEITPQGRVIFQIYKQEMGQGIATGLAMIAAEEMDANWTDVEIEFIEFDKNSPDLDKEEGRHDTGGSGSMMNEGPLMKEAGATVKALFITAAAKKWQLSEEEVFLDKGIIRNHRNQDEIPFGAIVHLAKKESVTKPLSFKHASNYQIIGKSLPTLKSKTIVDGTLKFSIDLNLPRMAHCMIVRPPVIGAKLIRFNQSEIKLMPGVIEVFKVDPIIRDEPFCKGIKGGIAIVANSTWHCVKARNQLKIEWDNGPNGSRGTHDLWKELDELSTREPRRPNKLAGNIEKGFEDSHKIVEASYQCPFLGHQLMEPLNSISNWTGEKLEIWAGTQSPHFSADNIAEVFGIKKKDITIHPYHMGGGNGRRFFPDYLMESAVVAREMKMPVKLIWTREDEMQHGYYHPQRKDYYKAGLDRNNNIVVVDHTIATMHQASGGRLPFVYGHKHLRTRSHSNRNKLLQCGAWRSVVKHSHYFPYEVFMDELAHAAGKDPIGFRIEQLERPYSKSYTIPAQSRIDGTYDFLRRNYLQHFKLIRTFSEWNKKRPNGVGLGVATAAYNNKSFCTIVAEIDSRKKIQISKIYVIIDCGLQINPSSIEAQVEGGILWALDPMINGGISAINGVVIEKNFQDKRILDMTQVPEILIQSVNLENRDPVGVGEFSVPPLAPAVLNGIFAASGRRIRSLRIPPELLATKY